MNLKGVIDGGIGVCKEKQKMSITDIKLKVEIPKTSDYLCIKVYLEKNFKE